MKCEIDLHNGALTCSERNSISEYCQVNSRSTAIALCDAQSSLRGFSRKSSKASLVAKDYGRRSSEFCSEQARVPLWKSISHYGSLWQPV